MKQYWWPRFTLLALLTVLAAAVVAPSFLKLKDDSSYPIKSRISLGLDLQGGLYMILGIDFKKVYRDEVRSYIRKMELVLADEGIKASAGDVADTDPMDPLHTLVLENAADVEKAETKIKEFFPSLVRLTRKEGSTLEYGLSAFTKGQIDEQSVSKSIEVIRNRIDEFGVTEPEIVSQGKDRIVVALPGVKDIDRAKDLIGKTAKLEFKMVNDDISPAKIQEWLDKATKAGVEFKKGDRFSEYLEKLNTLLKDDLPAGYALAFEKRVNPGTNESLPTIPYVVDKEPRLTGDELQDARVQIDQQKNEPYVSMDFKSAGAKRFEEITGEHIGKRMAVILDGNVYTAPVIQSKIGGGRAQITLGTGNFNKLMKEARDIALVLRAGALPVQLDFEEQRTVGPSLGHDSIEKAMLATVVGCALVFGFILFYYKVSGAIAIASLVFNVLFILAVLVGLEATLTLPGIAGIALTVGMGVDGNIIIYERIREELRKGLNPYKAVEQGFAQAFWTILDANVTTALAGVCLLNFGTGPIRGFAVTLLIGIAATVYCSYFVTKLMFEKYVSRGDRTELSI